MLRNRIFSVIWTAVLFVSVGCSDPEIPPSTVPEVSEPEIITTHTVAVTDQESFDYYFSLSASNNLSNRYYFEDSIGTRAVSTLTVTPKLSGFVSYQGYVKLQPVTVDTTKSPEVLQVRDVDLDYWGDGTNTYVTENRTQTNDETISFENVKYVFESADIMITYYHEGLSGDDTLTYRSVFLTKYNYKEYISVVVKEYSEYEYNETTGQNERQFYQSYDIYPTSQLKGHREYNHIVLKFTNGLTLRPDANGRVQYARKIDEESQQLPQLSDIDGCIDIYPSATVAY